MCKKWLKLLNVINVTDCFDLRSDGKKGHPVTAQWGFTTRCWLVGVDDGG